MTTRIHDAKRAAAPRARLAIPPSRDVNWAAAGWAGIIGGASFMLLEVFLNAGGGHATPVRQIAAIALGASVIPPPTPFTALVFVAAMAIHLPLSLIYARVLALLINGLAPARAMEGGAVFGAALYGVNYYAFTALFPWFALTRGSIALACHVVFGVIAGGVYAELSRRRGP